jgi:hypothetical protein
MHQISMWMNINFFSLNFIHSILFVVSLSFVSPLSLVLNVCIFIDSEGLDSKSSRVVGAYVTAGHHLQSLYFQIIDPLVHIHPIGSNFFLITFCDFQFSPDLSNPLLL